MNETVAVELTVNGRTERVAVEPRHLLSDVLRDEIGLTGTHVGCEHGVCGACTVLLDGDAVRSCLIFAVQAEGATVTTVEGLTPPDGLSPVQEAMRDCHALQCGFCTPGIVVSMTAYLTRQRRPVRRRAEGRAVGQPLSLHGVPGDPGGHAPGGRAHGRQLTRSRRRSDRRRATCRTF